MTAMTVDQLRTHAAAMRGRVGIVAVSAALYRDFAIETATNAAADPNLAATDEAFLRDVCAGIDGLAGDVDRRVYVPTEILYRLACFPVPITPPAPAAVPQLPAAPAPAAVDDQPPDVPPPKPKRRRKPKTDE